MIEPSEELRDQYGKAFELGYQRTVRALTARGIRYQDALELAQAAWVRAWERLSQLRDSCKIIPYVTTIAVRMARDEFRSRERFRQLNAEDHPIVGDSSAIDLVAIDLRRALPACLPRQNYLLQRVYFHECPVSEVARELGTSQGAVHSALSRARLVLRKQMGVSDALHGTRKQINVA